MFFVAIGLVILFISFLIALVSLIREQSLRSNELGTFNEVEGLEFIEESTIADIGRNQDLDDERGSVSFPDSTKSENQNLEETVPFPWEIESESGREVEANESKALDESVFENRGLNLGATSDNLTGEVSLKDLRRSNK